jgi:site-specific DNA-methyltransferase (adenine-specific)
MLEINKNYNMDCLDGLKLLDDNCIDLTVTSPPYDNLRDYNGYNFNFENIAKELYRVTKDGGIIVWVVGDQTINGSESGSSFRQALYFKDLGFNIHDTMIWEKNSSTFPANPNSKRYTQIFEYMFILSKGQPKTTNLIIDKKNTWAGFKDFSGKLKNEVPEFSARNNIWKFTTSFNDKTDHPAVFPEELVNDHIVTWSNPQDTVLDIFMGSGTTAKMSILNDRKWIGFEISKDYCDIIDTRVKGLYSQISLF